MWWRTQSVRSFLHKLKAGSSDTIGGVLDKYSVLGIHKWGLSELLWFRGLRAVIYEWGERALVEVSLVCAVHDPTGGNIPFLRRAAPTLIRIYAGMYVAVSEETAPAVTRELQQAGFATQVVPKTGAANARRDALRLASTTPFEYFHYCDLDRILT